MMTQKNLFEVTNGGILNYFEDKPLPPAIEQQNVRLPEELKDWVNSVATAVSTNTGNHKYGSSTVIREAVVFYKIFYAVRHKMLQSRKKIINFVESFI